MGRVAEDFGKRAPKPNSPRCRPNADRFSGFDLSFIAEKGWQDWLYRGKGSVSRLHQATMLRIWRANLILGPMRGGRHPYAGTAYGTKSGLTTS